MRLARTFGWLVALLLMLMVAGALVLHWASRSEGVLRWGIAKLGEQLPCRLTVQGLSGSLTEPIRIQRVVCESDALRVDASQVALDWSPWALTRERLDIARLQAATLVVASRGKSEAPLAAPASLALPLAVHVARLELGTVTVENGANPITLREIDASYDGGARSHQLVLRRLTSPWGSVQGELELGAQAPLPLSAKLQLASPTIEKWPIAVEAGLSGELRQIQAQITGNVGQLPVHAELTLAPFDPDPLPAIAVRIEGLDVNNLLAVGPTTAIDAQFKGAAHGTESLAGTLTAANASDGTLDQNRLPVRTLTAHATLTREAVVLERARISLGPAGAATGSARVDASGIAVDLTTGNLDLHALHAALRSTHLAGSVRLQVESGRQLIQADLRQDNLHVQAEAAIADDRLTLTQLAAQAAGASLRGSGELRLADDFAFSAQTVLHDFDPARFGDFPAARINGELAAQGHLRPDWRASLRYRLGPSSFRGQALGGHGLLTLSARRAQDVDAQLVLGGNRLALRGSFGRAGDALEFHLDAPRLAAIRADLAGRLRADGKLGGTPVRPELDATLEGNELSYGGVRVQRGTAAARIVQADDPGVHLDSKLQGVARGATTLDSLAVMVEGTLSSHTIALTANGTGMDLHAQARGGYDPKQHLWSGTLENVANAGDFALHLTQPAQLQVGAEHFALGRTGVAFAGGNLTLEETRFAHGALASSGSMTGMPLARLLRIVRHTPRLQSTLVLGGRWSLRGREQIEGMVEIARENGDLVITSDEAPVALGLTEVKLALQAAGDVVSVHASIRGTNLDVQASGETLLSQRDGKWGIAGDAPLKLQARADLGSLRPAVGLFTSAVTGDGKVSLDVTAAGTVADPHLRGEISGDRLRIEQVESGVFLREGVLRATFENGAVQLNTLTIRGGDGELSVTGRIGLRGRQLDLKLDWAARKLTAVQHPDLRLTVSGKGNVSVQDGLASVRGALTADRGRVELRSNSAPSLGEDVVVAGRKPKTTVTARSLHPEVDLALDLGPDFIVRGRGLDARLEGKVTLVGAGDAPLAAKGQISVVRGTYEAYGQRLEIDKGVLYFTGPLDNPGLEIVAMRKRMQVEAGVEVTGTARDPRVRLVSDPDVPDSEKLSWLVLGRGVEGAGTLEADKLQSAAMALAAGLGTAPLQQQLARAVGLDEIRIASTSSGGQQSSVVAVGKRLSDRIYLTYEHGVSAATNVLRISYQLTRNWSVRTEAGTAGAVDVFYTLSFD